MSTNIVSLQPGVNVQRTSSLNQAAIQSSNLIRFDRFTGLPQKLGGWTLYFPTVFASIIRALHAWEDLSAVNHLAVGSVDDLSVITGNTLLDITPQLTITNPAVNFSTTMNTTGVLIVDSGVVTSIYDVVFIDTQVSIGGIVLYGAYPVHQTISATEYQIQSATAAASTVTNGGAVAIYGSTATQNTITVNLANHGQSVGSTWPIVVPVTVGGVTLQGFYTVNTVTDSSHFTINAAQIASSTQTVAQNGGNAQISYFTAPGPPIHNAGWGAGGYGQGGYGIGVSPPIPPFTGSPYPATGWVLDNWGGTLVACPTNGPIFVWVPTSGLQAGQMIYQAPNANTGVFVSMPSQILVAYGSSVLGIQDPLLINWSNIGDYTVWTAAVSNAAGSYRIPRGSRIVGGIQGPQYALIWTDIDVWSMAFIGQPGIFGFSEIASGCGLLAQFGVTVLGTTVFWLSQKGFFALPAGGSVAPLPCTVWDFIYQQLDTANIQKIRAASNSQYDEVTWYFPIQGGNGENSAFVKFNTDLSCWDFGYLGRSAWIDQSVLGPPIGADPVALVIYQHETSPDAAGQPINSTFTTGFWDQSGGSDMAFVDMVYPEFRWGLFGGSQSSTVNISFTYCDYANGPQYTTPTYVMNSNSPAFLNVRFRGRLASMTVSSSDLGSFWRFGGLRVRTAPDGRL